MKKFIFILEYGLVFLTILASFIKFWGCGMVSFVTCPHTTLLHLLLHYMCIDIKSILFKRKEGDGYVPKLYMTLNFV